MAGSAAQTPRSLRRRNAPWSGFSVAGPAARGEVPTRTLLSDAHQPRLEARTGSRDASSSRPAFRVPVPAPAPVETPPLEVANARIKGPASVIVPLVEPPDDPAVATPETPAPLASASAIRFDPGLRHAPEQDAPHQVPPTHGHSWSDHRRSRAHRGSHGLSPSRRPALASPVRICRRGQGPRSTLAVRIRFPRPYSHPYRRLAEAAAARLPQDP